MSTSPALRFFPIALLVLAVPTLHAQDRLKTMPGYEQFQRVSRASSNAFVSGVSTRERYLWIPQEAKAAYDAASLMTYAPNLRGRLMLFYGTADNNVHPNNAMQFIQALQRAGKSFEVQVGPDIGHASINHDRMMEFFIENLVLR